MKIFKEEREPSSCEGYGNLEIPLCMIFVKRKEQKSGIRGEKFWRVA